MQQRLYTQPSQSQLSNTPQPVRFTNVDQILVKAASEPAIPAAIEQITQLLHERHRIPDGEPDDFNIRDMTEKTKALAGTSQTMGMLLLCVALISLVVGGVGIMNIMLVSVTERTREIGLRMAVGARGDDVLRQFLVEAIVLCLIGGAVGILIGRGGSLLVNTLLRWPVQFSTPAVLLAVGVSAVRRHRVRLLPGVESLAARSDRSAAVRVTAASRLDHSEPTVSLYSRSTRLPPSPFSV